MENRVSLKVPSDPKFLSLVRKVVGKAAELAGFDEFFYTQRFET